MNSKTIVRSTLAATALSLAGLWSPTALAQDRVAYHIDDAATQGLKGLRNIRNHLDTDPSARITVVTHANGVDFFLDGAKDAGNQGDADPVAQFRVLEAQRGDLLRHRETVLMPVREPAGGQGEDGLHRGRSAQKGGRGRRVGKRKPVKCLSFGRTGRPPGNTKPRPAEAGARLGCEALTPYSA